MALLVSRFGPVIRGSYAAASTCSSSQKIDLFSFLRSSTACRSFSGTRSAESGLCRRTGEIGRGVLRMDFQVLFKEKFNDIVKDIREDLERHRLLLEKEGMYVYRSDTLVFYCEELKRLERDLLMIPNCPELPRDTSVMSPFMTPISPFAMVLNDEEKETISSLLFAFIEKVAVKEKGRKRFIGGMAGLEMHYSINPDFIEKLDVYSRNLVFGFALESVEYSIKRFQFLEAVRYLSLLCSSSQYSFQKGPLYHKMGLLFLSEAIMSRNDEKFHVMMNGSIHNFRMAVTCHEEEECATHVDNLRTVLLLWNSCREFGSEDIQDEVRQLTRKLILENEMQIINVSILTNRYFPQDTIPKRLQE